MHSPSVSVVIPCYNTGKWVGEAIQSAVDQTHPETEIIVIDDGSTDNSLEVIRSFGNTIRFEAGSHRGGNHARNRGIELADGEWIQFLDADDILMRTKLARQLPFSIRSPDTLVFTQWYVFRESFQEAIAETRSLRSSSCEALDLLLDLAPPLPISAGLHSKQLLTRVGCFRPELPCCQDLDLHLRIAAEGVRFEKMAEALFAVREVTSSLSRRDYGQILDYQALVLMEALSSFSKNGRLTRERRAVIARAIGTGARHYARLRRWDDAAARLRLARSVDDIGAFAAYNALYRVLVALAGFRIAEAMVRCRAVLRHALGKYTSRVAGQTG